MNTLQAEIAARYADPQALATRLIARIDAVMPAPAPAEPTKAQLIASARRSSRRSIR